MLRVQLVLLMAAANFALPAWANHDEGNPLRPIAGPHAALQVPEIDASVGLQAVAAIAVLLLYFWERRRRSSSK